MATYPGKDIEREAPCASCAACGQTTLAPAEAAAAADSQTLRMKLREMRRRLIVNIIGRNATGRIDYFEVVRLMSDFAETAVTATVKVNARELAERCGVLRRGVPRVHARRAEFDPRTGRAMGVYVDVREHPDCKCRNFSGSIANLEPIF